MRDIDCQYQNHFLSLLNQIRDIKCKAYMCVNKVLLETAYKNNHVGITHSFFKLHAMSMGQHFWVTFGYLNRQLRYPLCIIFIRSGINILGENN